MTHQPLSWPGEDPLPIPRAIAAPVTTLLRRCARLIPALWLARCWRDASGETIVATHGAVEILHIPAGLMLRTRVKGESAQARETGLRRLTNYLHGDNRSSILLRAAGPVVQQQLAPGRWLVSARLADTQAGPAPCTRRVKLEERDAELLAVVRVAGRPAHDSISRGDALILDTIAGTEWIATGTPMLRLRSPGPMRWFARGFQIAVPVVNRASVRPDQ